jgi:hypothetical protein
MQPRTPSCRPSFDPDRTASTSFTLVELRRIERIGEDNRYLLLELWDASFGV